MPIVEQPSSPAFQEPEMTPVEGIPPADEAGPPSDGPVPVKTVPTQWILIGLGTIAFLYFARPVVLPLFLAILAAMALKPMMRWLAMLRLPPAPAAAIVFSLLVAC